MAGFKGHVTFGIVTAVLYSGFSFVVIGAPAHIAQASFLLTVFASMLPDIDSNSGHPVQIVFALLSIIATLLTFDVLRHGHHITLVSAALTICSGLIVYTVVQTFFKQVTHHRGAFHTIPMALIFGLVTAQILKFYQFYIYDIYVLSSAVICGYLCHLLLDELNSLKGSGASLLRPKKSFGTALKLTASSSTSTACMYLTLCYL
ncbi:MAG: metal-dependent hydrolase, partial [Pseudomonadota bacterium]|nr:metal-dependent hydrolase [Pseudomonadota bacterium]